MKNLRQALLSLLVCGATLSAADSGTPIALPPNASKVKPGKWEFSLLPKAFQRRPLLDFNVITEMTPEGKRQPLPSAEQPIYYTEQAGPEARPGPQMNQKTPPVADLEQAMRSALGFNHYLPATPEHRTTLLIVFTYGSFYADTPQPPPGQPPPDMPPVTAEELLPYIVYDKQLRVEMIERAGLVGGSRFANELTDALIQEIANVQLNEEGGGGAPIIAGIGALPKAPVSPNPASPFQMFLSSHNDQRGLVEDAFTGCYFVVASAYDYAMASQNRKLLLWRTKMTVNSFGVSMAETLQPLIANAAPYFGRPMAAPESVTRRLDREGKIDVGVPRVVPDDDAAEEAGKPLGGKKPATSTNSP